MFWPSKRKVAPKGKAASPVPDKALLQQALVRNACHPFYAGFRIIGRFHRLVGCAFLENLASLHHGGVRARRASLYLLYPLALWLFFLLANVALVVDTELHHELGGSSSVVLRDTERLNRSIFLAFMLAVNVEAALNTALLLVQAPRFVELLRMCAVVELHTAVPPYVQTQAVRFAWNLIAFQAAVALLYVCLSAYSDFGTALLSNAGRSGALVPLLTPLAVAYGVLGTPLVSVMCLSTRLWLMYFSRVIALYLACIHRNLDQCLRSRSTPESRKVVLVDQMRVQLSLLKNCADLASSLLGPSLLYAYAYSVAILCAAAYYTIIPDLQARVRLFFFFFGFLHWLSILLPTLTAHHVRSAVADLRSAVQGLSMAHYSDDLLAQLRTMLNSIQHDDLKFTGCGFFVVDLSTFADIMGAVITYTVVLVQTNDSYLRGSLEHCANKTSA